MFKKMIKRIAAAIMLSILMIYLSISVSAALTFDELTYYMLMDTEPVATDRSSWKEITELPIEVLNQNSHASAVDNQTLFLLFDANHIITEGDVIVIQVALRNVTDTITFEGIGKITDSSFLPGNQNWSRTILSTLIPDQKVIASTIQEIGQNTKRITVTFTASGFANTYAFARYNNILREGTEILMTEIDLYDSVEDAAGSGTTPEEMRAVLEEWTEETLLPGMEQSVSSGVQSGMEAALEDEKQQASSGAQGGLDELAGALSGVTEDITQAKQSFETLGSALSYSGTSASLTFPAMTVPFLGTISEAQPINLTEQIDNIMPPTLLLIIRCALSIGIVSYPIFELITQLRKLLDKG